MTVVLIKEVFQIHNLLNEHEFGTGDIQMMFTSFTRGGSRIGLRGGLSISRALARAKFYVLRPLLTSFPHTTSYTKKK